MKRHAIFVLAGIVATMPASAWAGCKPQVSGFGTGFSKSAAELAARLSWNVNAKQQHGIAYAQWPKSQNKSSNTKKIKFQSWESTFYADPCN